MKAPIPPSHTTTTTDYGDSYFKLMRVEVWVLLTLCWCAWRGVTVFLWCLPRGEQLFSLSLGCSFPHPLVEGMKFFCGGFSCLYLFLFPDYQVPWFQVWNIRGKKKTQELVLLLSTFQCLLTFNLCLMSSILVVLNERNRRTYVWFIFPKVEVIILSEC